MAMGTWRRESQEAMLIAADRLPKSGGHPFYAKLNELLAEAGFDAWIEKRCKPYYAADGASGRPSIPPGVYFRMLLVGYFEGIDSQRGIAWRCADSLGLRRFLGIALDEPTPDHSSLTVIRKRLPAEVFDEVFRFVLAIAALKGLLSGTTVGVAGTMLEANAAMKSIVRKDTGEDWRAYVVRLIREEGLIAADAEPTDEEVRRAVLENRRRVGRDKSRKLQRLQSERVERSFAHVCETGGSRRSWLSGFAEVTKRYRIAVAAHNLGRMLRKLFGIGKPRVLQGGLAAMARLEFICAAIAWLLAAFARRPRRPHADLPRAVA